MVLREDEWLRLTPIIEDGEAVVDMRVWRKTPTGGVPTKRAITISQTSVIPMIIQLQKLHARVSADSTLTSEASQG